MSVVATRLAGASHPFVYEINTWPWLDELGRRHGSPVDLSSVPGSEWDALAELGFDAVWLMGVWQRSPVGVGLALADEAIVRDLRRALPDLTDADVVGSPYCIRGYVVDDALGGRAGLAAARAALAERGLGLLLDFVPNHVAPDHPWVTARPELFVRGSDDDLAHDPASFVRIGDSVLANGRDPYFPAWPDVVQLDAFSPGLRAAVVDTLLDIADQCDGVRCDMSMLMLDDVFARTWGGRVGPAPEAEYWDVVIPAVRAHHPGFLFIAEAYWDLEWRLQELGFDFCYDKRLYDRLVNDDAESVRLHLCADLAYQDRLVRFLENHDEPRAADVFAPDRERAAAVATLTQTGAKLVHDGQLDGRRVRLPVFLGRYPDEAPDARLAGFHRELLGALSDPAFRRGRWRLCERGGWPGDDTFVHLVAWCWEADSRWLIVVNLSDVVATGHVATGWGDLPGRDVRLVDPTADTALDRRGDDVVSGLYVQLPPWGSHIWRVEDPDDDREVEPGSNDRTAGTVGR